MLGASTFGGVLVPSTLLALVFLALTNFLLVYKLERRDRFFYVLTKPQWGSWLVRGAYIMTAYGAFLMFGLVFFLAGREPPGFLLVLILVAALGTSIYSAFLFNQAKGRDLWQSSVLPVHLLAHAVVAGAATIGLAASLGTSLSPVTPLMGRVLAGGFHQSLILHIHNVFLDIIR